MWPVMGARAATLRGKASASLRNAVRSAEPAEMRSAASGATRYAQVCSNPPGPAALVHTTRRAQLIEHEALELGLRAALKKIGEAPERHLNKPPRGWGMTELAHRPRRCRPRPPTRRRGRGPRSFVTRRGVRAIARASARGARRPRGGAGRIRGRGWPRGPRVTPRARGAPGRARGPGTAAVVARAEARLGLDGGAHLGARGLGGARGDRRGELDLGAAGARRRSRRCGSSLASASTRRTQVAAVRVEAAERGGREARARTGRAPPSWSSEGAPDGGAKRCGSTVVRRAHTGAMRVQKSETTKDRSAPCEHTIGSPSASPPAPPPEWTPSGSWARGSSARPLRWMQWARARPAERTHARLGQRRGGRAEQRRGEREVTENVRGHGAGWFRGLGAV